jgi:hypothetical protein
VISVVFDRTGLVLCVSSSQDEERLVDCVILCFQVNFKIKSIYKIGNRCFMRACCKEEYLSTKNEDKKAMHVVKMTYVYF